MGRFSSEGHGSVALVIRHEAEGTTLRGNDSKGRHKTVRGVKNKMNQDNAVREGDGSSGAAPKDDMDTGLEPNLQAHIGRHVRAAFDEVAKEPIPDHLLQLLKELERGGDK